MRRKSEYAADSVEAISRQMPEPTLARLQAMIREVSLKRLVDGQFDECGITFLELKQIEEAFLQVLVGIFVGLWLFSWGLTACSAWIRWHYFDQTL